MITMQESNYYLDKRDNTIVTLLLRSNGFIRVRPNKGLDIVMSVECFEENLLHYVREERYEDCQKIVNTINELKNQNISDIISELKK